ncbi:Choline transport protein [Cladobotryum mycophilum]|uniref:Choline transport protein n=1 Tax=Cladobotryum mycophilum TaxID=491253 RepID=A0ABR0S5J3_9HYPO
MMTNCEDHELGNVVAIKSYTPRVMGGSDGEHRDSEQLARLGKKAVLKRNFGFMSILGFSCTVLITWEGMTVMFRQGLMNGGPAGLIYGFIVVWLGNVSMYSALCELVSMAPTAGGQYHWVAMLAPRSSAKFLSYITGWLMAGGWQGSFASAAYLSATIIQGLVKLTVPSYDIQRYQSTLLMWAVVLFAGMINVITGSLLANDAKTIFTTFTNGGNWPTQGLSFFVGMLGNVFLFQGADAAFHMAEEVRNPSLVIPQSVMLSVIINGCLGFAMTLALVFCMGDVEAALASVTGYPFLEIFGQATHSIGGTTAMASIVLVLGVCGTVGILATTSRIFWSFARDRGLPFWKTLSKVDKRTTIPIWSIATTAILCCLLAIIIIGSSDAFQIIISLSVVCLHGSYFICLALLLYRRCTSGFALPDMEGTTLPALADTAGEKLVWGPWRIPGAYGIINNAVACIYVIIVWFFSLWPTTTPVDALTFNYSIVITAAVAIISIVYYLVRARKIWQGPIVEVQ